MERAQFLQGLRTGGPRPSLNAQPSQSVPRFQNSMYDDAQTTQMADALQQMSLGQTMPLALQQQQQLALLQAQAQVAAMMASQGGGAQAQAQALQMQIEVMKLQAIQQQQQSFQAQLLLQSQIAASQNRRRSEQHSLSPVVANSAGQDPSAAQTRMTVANQLRARAIGREISAINPAVPEEAHVSPPLPSAAAGSAPRAVSTPLNPNAAAFVGRFNPELAAAIAAASKSPAISETNSPATPTYGSTTVISGGTSLGSATAQSPGPNSLSSTPANSYNNLSGYNSPVTPGPTKSDNATSWRRGSITPATSIYAAPSSGVGKPPSPPARNDSTSPPPEIALSSAVSRSSLSSISSASVVSLDTPSNGTPLPTKTRPSPLRFSKVGNDDQSRVVVARAGSPSSQSTDGNENDTGSANGSSKGSPTGTTPPSSAHSEENANTLKKEREEASKRLYEGLGLGRPVPSPKTTQFNVHAVPFTLNTNLPTFTTTLATPSPNTLPTSASVSHAGAPSTARVASLVITKQELPQPHRQPIGPPSSVDELGPRNFASRLRKKALGGLGVLMDARDRREGYQIGGEMTVA